MTRTLAVTAGHREAGTAGRRVLWGRRPRAVGPARAVGARRDLGQPASAQLRPSLLSAVVQSDAMAFCAAASLTRPSQTAACRAFSTLSLGFVVGGVSGHRLAASLAPPSSSETRWSSSVFFECGSWYAG